MNSRATPHLSIFVVSCAYAIFIQFGPLGYGIDVHESYQYADTWPLGTEPIGWMISSFWVDFLGSRIFIGPALTSFLLCFGLFCFIIQILGHRFGIYFSMLIAFLLLFTHPVILSGTNVLRQGVATGFFFLFLYKFINRNIKQSIFFSLLSALSHNGIILILITFHIAIIPVSHKLKKWLYFLLLVLVYLSVDFVLSLKTSIDSDTNYKIVAAILLLGYSLIFILFPQRYFSSYFSSMENIVKNILFYNLLLVVSMTNSPSTVQRLLMILFIPVILFMILGLPVRIFVKLFVLFVFSSLWVFVTLTSSTLQTWTTL